MVSVSFVPEAIATVCHTIEISRYSVLNKQKGEFKIEPDQRQYFQHHALFIDLKVSSIC
jgi:hypothetical protein